MTEFAEEQMSIFAQDTWSGRMSQEPSAPTEEKTSQRSLKKRSGSQSRKPPMWMCLKKDGLQADASSMRWESGALPGEFSMHSFGESPKDAVESHLSQILEDSPHPKYSLSAKACQGILNRANRRGKKLPELLEKALVDQSLAPSKFEEDALGGGKGALIQTDKSATLSTLQDQTLFQPVIAVDQGGGKSGAHSYENVSPTLTCTHGGEPAVAYGIQCSMIGRADKNGPQGDGVNENVSFTLNTTDRHAVVYGISPYHSNCMLSDNPHSGYYEADTARTLDALQCGYPGCNQGGMAVVQPICFEPGAASRMGGYCYEDKCGTLRATMGDNQFSVAYSIENHPADSRVDIDDSGKVQTLTSRMGIGGGNVPMVLEAHQDMVLDDQGGSQINVRSDGKSPTLRAETHGNLPMVMMPMLGSGKDVTGCLMASGYDKLGAQEMFSGDYTIIQTQVESIPYAAQSYSEIKESPVGASLKACGGVLGGGSENFIVSGVDCRNATEYEEQTGTLQADCSHNHNSNNVVRVKHIVRRLTPLECERLQGFPDGWTDIGEWVDSKGKKHKEADSPRYKALGNSIALPPWKWVLKRLCACYERDATMASLFDGIGGFPYIWEQLNGKGSCLWASEIEEFPMAVTKVRFGGESGGRP